MKKIISIMFVLVMTLALFALPVSASSPYQTYTYSIDGTALNSPDAYTPQREVDAKKMGLENEEMLRKFHPEFDEICVRLESTEAKLNKLSSGDADYEDTKNAYDKAVEDYKKKYEALSKISNPTDIEVDSDNNVYIVDSGNSRIIVLGKDYKVKFIISSFYNRMGISDSFKAPQGVYITADNEQTGKEGKIYVCDTENSRIVTFDREGNFMDIIAKPESDLFGSSNIYTPVAIAVDAYNRLYVVSSNTYQGIIVMTESGEFTGFVGAQKVSISAWDKLWRRFKTEEQRKQDDELISSPFNNITLTGDFIYATISLPKEYESKVLASLTDKTGDYAPVKMLNASGDEIMRRNGFFGPGGEIDNKQTNTTDTIFGASTIVDVAVGPEKTWSIIDQKRSKVFTYDFDGNLLFAFGDNGRQLGNIDKDSLNGIVYHGDSMLLLNKTDATFTVYNRTEYGDTLIDALANQNNRRNDEAIEDWEEILKRNSNFDAAYIGIGNALANQNKYAESLDYYKAAYDTENYSNAYKELRKEWISKFIILIPIFVIAVAIGCSKFLGFAKKYNKRVSTMSGKRTYAQEIMFVFHVIFHPFDGFWDLKHEKRGSVRGALTILGATILVFYYQAIGRGYIMNAKEEYASAGGVVIGILVPLFLWIISNWCLTTLFEGEGSLKDIFIATCYSLAPLAIILVPVTIASNFIIASEVGLITLFSTIAYIWTGILIFFGTMITHDYAMGKNVITTVGTILGMVVIMFIAILFSTLLGKLVGFVTNIVTEIQFRM